MLKRGEIVLVTGSEGKAKEFVDLASDYGIPIRWVKYAKPEIQGERLEDIARFSAISMFQIIGSPLIVEDAGLFIEALNGFPGPYTSFVNRTIGIQGVLRLMSGIENRKAYFKSVICYVDEDSTHIFVGTVDGSISLEPKGENGFGFDPIFVPEKDKRTFAQMEPQLKNRISHRSRAFSKLASFLSTKSLKGREFHSLG
jgi:XTP/dITP diphosphohydrolase